jgi:hypothetical protein
MKKGLKIVGLFSISLCFYMNVIQAQVVTSVNGQTGNVQINLSLINNDLKISGGNTIPIPSFWTNSGSNIYTNFSGNIGIGSISPDNKLTVKGTVHAKELIVNSTVSGPDYVFEKNYSLLPIEDLKHFIIQNKHLPEVPPANEMKTHGIKLSAMNMLILKKIEELSLYIIQNEKRIRELEK